MTERALAWSGGMISSAILVALVAFVFPLAPVRPVLVVPFLLICPGMALIRRFRLAEWWVELILAIAVSVAIDTLLATAMAYAGVWSPRLLLGVLVCLSLIAGIEELIRRLAT
jgi:uncharacterized membrane protein